jgi:hypothetical protein
MQSCIGIFVLLDFRKLGSMTDKQGMVGENQGIRPCHPLSLSLSTCAHDIRSLVKGFATVDPHVTETVVNH